MKTPKPIQDRRRAMRVEESLPFHIGHDHYEVEVRTVNISKTGVLCLMDKPIPVMTKLKVGLQLPGKGRPSTVQAQGVVVRREPDPASDRFYIGIFFSEIQPKDLRLLEEFIEQRLNA